MGEQIKKLIDELKQDDENTQSNKQYSDEYKTQARCFFREVIFKLEQILSANK